MVFQTNRKKVRMEALEMNKCSPVERARAFHRALSMQHIGVLSHNKKTYFRPKCPRNTLSGSLVAVYSPGEQAVITKSQERTEPPNRSGTACPGCTMQPVKHLCRGIDQSLVKIDHGLTTPLVKVTLFVSCYIVL